MSEVDFFNRVAKDFRHRRKWARRRGLTAYRVYDRDIPEHRYAVDWYAGEILVSVYEPKRGVQTLDEGRLTLGLAEVFGVAPEQIHVKRRTPHAWGASQYEKHGAGGARAVVEENGLKFLVDLESYLDTGLFLDHRDTRARVRAEAEGKRFLNLFAYTGAFTVYAAAGGARSTTSVDLSNTYLDWAGENLALNGFDPEGHERLRSDVTRWVRQVAGRRTFDLVVLDPPTRSASKKMVRSFNVQHDHLELVRDTLRLLAPGGVLYFSTNYRGFVLDPEAVAGCAWEELTPASIPEDFRDRTIHRCFRIVRP